MINGIDYLKKMYPNRDEKDYQPSGLDLRLGNVFFLDADRDTKYGIYSGKKVLPQHSEARLVEQDGVKGWKLLTGQPYIGQVQEQIKIGDNNAQLYLPRSTLLRAGVNVYTALGDLGYNGHLSFLVINHGPRPFFIEKGERFAQLIDLQVRGGSESYQGDYQEKEVVADDNKGIWKTGDMV